MHKSILGECHGADWRDGGEALTGVATHVVARPAFEASDGAAFTFGDRRFGVQSWHCCRCRGAGDPTLRECGAAGLSTKGNVCCVWTVSTTARG